MTEPNPAPTPDRPADRYPGLRAMPDQSLREIVEDPQVGLMADAADVVAFARALLAERASATAPKGT